MRTPTIYRILAILLSVSPFLAFAAAPQNFAQVVILIISYIKALVMLLFGLTFAMFVWGLVRMFFLNGGNQENIEKGQQVALWGVIGLAVISAMWGIIVLIRNSMGFSS